jgi:hypothetical protein
VSTGRFFPPEGLFHRSKKDFVFETNFLDYFSNFYILDVRVLEKKEVSP